MQFMTFNSLLMFDIVFVFFLFLVGVTCLVYYLPPVKSTKNYTIPIDSNSSCRYHQRQQQQQFQQYSSHSSIHQLHPTSINQLNSNNRKSVTIASNVTENNQNLNNCINYYCDNVLTTENCQNCLLTQTRSSDYCIECSCDENCACQVLRDIEIKKYSNETNCYSSASSSSNISKASSKVAFVKAKLCDLKKCSGPVDDV